MPNTDSTDLLSQSAPAESSTIGLTKKVAKGTVWTLAGQVIPLFSTIISVPIIIRILGTESYGIYALVGLLPSYAAFADFGMNLASTTFASEAYAKGLRSNEGQIVRVAAGITLVTSLLTALILVLFAEPIIVDLLQIPAPLQALAITAFYLSTVTLTTRLLSTVLNTPQLVRLRMELNSMINAGFNTVQIVFVVIVIWLGGGVVGAVTVIAFVSVLNLLTHILVSRRLLPELFELSFPVALVKPLLKFGVGVVTFSIATILLGNLEKVVVTRYGSVATFAHYTVAFTFANMIGLFSGALIQSLIPAFTQLKSRENDGELQELYTRGIRFNLILLAPVAMLFCVVARPFFTIWAGVEFGQESTYPFYVLVVGWLANIVALVPFSILLATKQTKAVAILVWCEIVPYVLLTIFLTKQYGSIGTAAAWSVRVVVDSVMLILLARRLAGLSIEGVLSRFGRLVIGYLILAVPVFLTIFAKELQYWWITLSVVALAAYASFVWKAVMLENERKFMNRQRRALFSKLKSLVRFAPGQV